VESQADFQFDDVFSEAWRKQATAAIERMVAADQENPKLIGYFWTDMPAWDLKVAKQKHGRHWVDFIRGLPDDAPGKQRYEAFLKANEATAATDHDFLLVIAREYYRHIGTETRRLDPDTLVFGERYPGRALDFDVIREAIPYIDVISVQPGAVEYMEKEFDKLYETLEKPIVICDHQCSFATKTHPKTMWVQLDSVEEVKRAHNAYMEKAFSKPYFIGYFRCQYIDRLKGPVLKQGLLNAKGRPYAELVETIAAINGKILSSFGRP